jgi:hypothetical protein
MRNFIEFISEQIELSKIDPYGEEDWEDEGPLEEVNWEIGDEFVLRRSGNPGNVGDRGIITDIVQNQPHHFPYTDQGVYYEIYINDRYLYYPDLPINFFRRVNKIMGEPRKRDQNDRKISGRNI